MTRLTCTCPSCGRRMGHLTLGTALIVAIVGLAAAIGVMLAMHGI